MSESADKKQGPDYVAIGRMGGLKGGPARAQRLTPERRKEIARLGGKARQRRAETSTTESEHDSSAD